MFRLIFWGSTILAVLLVGAVVDQIFYRLMRLFFDKHLANVIRLWAFIITVVVLVVSGLWGHYITRVRVNINNVYVKSEKLPKSFDGFRIAHISDFHIDSFDSNKEMDVVEEIVDKILSEKPDIICFTGDIVTQRSAQLVPFRHTLKRLASAGIPVFSVMGNHDYAEYYWAFDEKRRLQDQDSLRFMQKEMGWQMLDNANKVIVRGTDSILVVGVENIGEPPFTSYGDLKKALPEESGELPFTILLSHNPNHWRMEVLPETDIDLMLAGHTHKMQFSIFGWSPSSWRYKECAGLYQEGTQYLYVNSGLGCTGPKIRIGVRPEITIITINR